MTSLTRIGFCAIAAAWLGCGTSVEDAATRGADPAPDAGGLMELAVRSSPVEHHGGVGFPGDTDHGTVIVEVEPQAACGDGRLDVNEECDDGNSITGDGCSSDCKFEQVCCCGDGTVNTGEDCDDGNTASGDGCSSDCKLELLP